MYCLLRHRNFDNRTTFYKSLSGALQVSVLPEVLLTMNIKIVVFRNVCWLCSNFI